MKPFTRKAQNFLSAFVFFKSEFKIRRNYILSLKKHLEKLHNRKSKGGSLDFQCEHSECGKRFSNNVQLELHQKIHRNDLHKCFFCPWAGVQHQDISAHYDRHFLHPRFKCPECERAFFRKQEMNDHLENVHEKTVGRYKCKFCNFMTHNRTSFNSHVRIQHK